MKEALYRAVVEDQSEYIIRYRPDRTITLVNDAYCRAFGIDRLFSLVEVFTPPTVIAAGFTPMGGVILCAIGLVKERKEQFLPEYGD